MDWLPVFDELRTTDYLLLGLGLLGIVLALVSLLLIRGAYKRAAKAEELCDATDRRYADVEKRAIHATEKAAENAVRQDRDEVLNLSVTAESDLLALKRRVAIVRTEARFEGLEPIYMAGGQLVARFDEKLKVVRLLLVETRKDLPAKEDWAALRRQLIDIKESLSRIVDRQTLEDSAADYVDRSTEAIAAARTTRNGSSARRRPVPIATAPSTAVTH